jgi:putative hydrolase of the HAD superfamily
MNFKKSNRLNSNNIKEVIVFDLDDTLFEEKDFVLSGFAAVAADIAKTVATKKQFVFNYLLEQFYKKGRGKIFNAALRQFGLIDTPDEITRLVQLYRQHPADITFYPGVKSLLKRLHKNFYLAVVTDGATETQANKVRALGLQGLADYIVYCWEIGAPKPDAKGYAMTLDYFNMPANHTMIIGDHPINDIAAAKELGAWTIRVHTGRFSLLPNLETKKPDFDIKIVTDIEQILPFIKKDQLGGLTNYVKHDA